MVDRSVGRTIHGQWVQQPGSFILTGVYTHQVSATKLYTKGFLGWFKMHKSVFSTLKSPTFRNSMSAPSASVWPYDAAKQKFRSSDVAMHHLSLKVSLWLPKDTRLPGNLKP
jgi:hypothetical protein